MKVEQIWGEWQGAIAGTALWNVWEMNANECYVRCTGWSQIFAFMEMGQIAQREKTFLKSLR